MKIDISQDWALVDNLFSVTLKVAGSSDAYIPNCVLDEPTTIREMEPSGAQVLRQGTVFIWPKKFSVQPPIGSIVVDDEGTYWTVWKCIKKRALDMYEPFCLNLNIVTAATNKATLLRATYIKGGANEAVAVWHGYNSGQTTPTDADKVTARFQPSEETAKLEFGADNSQEMYRVYFSNPPAIELAGGEFRLLNSDGHSFRVLKYYCEGRIDKLAVAVCEKITEGETWFANPTPGP